MIDAELLDAYIAELEALRVHGRDLARAYPDIAGRLDIGPRRSRDSQVERVVESAAFLAARLRMMIESTATELPLASLEMLAPTLIEPVPSMAVLEMRSGPESHVVPKGTRFDYMLAGQPLVCFSTTMSLTLAPVSLRLRNLEPTGGMASGIGIKFQGDPPSQITFCLGNDELSAAVLMDAITEHLLAIEVIPPNSAMTPRRIPRSSLRVCGFSADEAALPKRPAAHAAARLATEFMVFPEKFRFVTLGGVPLQSGSEILLRFKKPLGLPSRLPVDIISVNKVPAINLWHAPATPFDIDGRQLEFPVRVDALRYRTVECHSVEKVDVYKESTSEAHRIDPIVAFGNILGSEVRWGVRRTTTSVGAEILMYFQGLDYRNLGYQRYLAAPSVLASNRDLAQRAVVGTLLEAVEGGFAGWQATLSTAPTPYYSGISGSRAMSVLIGYINSSMNSFTSTNGAATLHSYLRRFPGSRQANWINGVKFVALRPVTVIRNGQPVAGLAMIINFDTRRHKTTSAAIIKRVLGAVFESQRGLNRIEEVIIQTI